MDKVAVFWDPEGIRLDALGDTKLLELSDGDTPIVSMSIRMLSVDSPELHYPDGAHPSRQDKPLKQLAEWIAAGKAPLHPELAQHLLPRLATGKAGTLQAAQGEAAAQAFQKLVDERLARPTGTRRRVFLRTGDQPFDQYGRLLAYMAPQYTSDEIAGLTPRERATFNLQMIAGGWGASFPIYPSLPKYDDLTMLREAAREACEGNLGAWADPLALTGYEFRMCVRLYEITKDLVGGKKLSSSQKEAWIDRYCADMTTREIFPPQLYLRVKPWNRLFVWPSDVNEAVGRLSLVPGDF